MTITKYRVCRYFDGYKEAHFERETDKCLFDANGRKCMKANSYETYYDTKEQAEAVVAARMKAKNDAANRRRLNDAAPDLAEALHAIIEACKAAEADDYLSIADLFTEEMESAAKAALLKAGYAEE